MKIDLKEYILEKRQVLLAVALGLLIYSLVLLLYQIPPEAAGYGILIVFIAEFVWLLSGFGLLSEKTEAFKAACGRAGEGFLPSGSPGERGPEGGSLSGSHRVAAQGEEPERGGSRRETPGYGGILYALGASDQDADRGHESPSSGGGHAGKWRAFDGTFPDRAVCGDGAPVSPPGQPGP